MRVVVALGGNALLRRGEAADAAVQLAHIRDAARALAPLAAVHELLVCHGNGPQIGLLALESQADDTLERPYPLDALGAATQGMIGYWLCLSLRNAGVTKPVTTVVTQVVVDRDDPAFSAPTKFVGPGYPQEQARRYAERYGWDVAADGASWRRVVPSPRPVRVVEQSTVDALLTAGQVVVCAGGGGAPVVEGPGGLLTGAEAVVDKDLTAALLAVELGADRLLVLTDVAAVMSGFGTPQAAPLRHLAADGSDGALFPAGSMGPKVEACRQFAVRTGRPAAIGALAEAAEVLAGTAGTTVGAPLPVGGRS